MPSLEKRIRREAADAKRDPAMLASFRALRLNQGTDDVLRSMLIDSSVWRRAERLEPVDMRGRYALGLDLGQSAAMSAAAAFWPESGRLDAFAVFPELPDIRERGLADGVGNLYVRMVERGELLLAGRHVADVRALLREVLDRWGRPGAIACDRWREGDLHEALDAVRFPWTDVAVRGQGFKDGGEDVRTFRKAIIGGAVLPSRSLLLRAAMGEARVPSATRPAIGSSPRKRKAGGGPKRATMRRRRPILAVAEGTRRHTRTPRRAAALGDRRLMAGRGSRHHAALDGRRWQWTRLKVFERDGWRCRAVRGGPAGSNAITWYRSARAARPSTWTTCKPSAAGATSTNRRRSPESRTRPAMPGAPWWRNCRADLRDFPQSQVLDRRFDFSGGARILSACPLPDRCAAMTTAQKLAIRLSEIRQRLNEIAGLEGDAVTDEIRAEAPPPPPPPDKLTGGVPGEGNAAPRRPCGGGGRAADRRGRNSGTATASRPKSGRCSTGWGFTTT